MMKESSEGDGASATRSSSKNNKALAEEAAIRDRDIQALLEAGVDMVQLEELYGVKAVQQAAEAYITKTSSVTEQEQQQQEEQSHEERRSKLASLLFLRAPSTSLQSIMKSDQVIDRVFQALVADPEDPLLMDPLLHTPMHDPVVLSSGIIVDRSTAINKNGKLRLQKCPFRRIPIQLPVYELYPLQEKVRAWEYDRLQKCISVAQTMLKQKDYERAEKVFQIANGFLQEHIQRSTTTTATTTGGSTTSAGTAATTTNNANHPSSVSTNISYNITSIPPQRHQSREILLLAIQLAQLERELPQVKDDIQRIVQTHQRLIQVAQACSTDKVDLQTLVIACLEDCWKRCNMVLALNSTRTGGRKALEIRHVFAPLMKYTTLLQLNLTEELQKVCQLDLTLAKHVEDEGSLWNSRRVLLKLLPEKEKAEFLKQEGINGDENELYFHLPYDYHHWPHDKFLDKSIGLVHFAAKNTNDSSNEKGKATSTASNKTLTQGLPCSVDLNPRPNGDHWIEVAFRPDNIQSPGHLNTIFSQHGPNTGWEIRCAVRPTKNFFAQTIDVGGIHVEALWTSSSHPVRGGVQHNELTNTKVPIEIGTWYHVILVYAHKAQTLSLYVNGQPVRSKVTGDFVPDHRLPILGQNVNWKERRFQGWVAFASGGYEIPIEETTANSCSGSVEDEEAALDNHVLRLAQARLAKLPKQPVLLHQETTVLEDVELDASGKSIHLNDNESEDSDHVEEEGDVSSSGTGSSSSSANDDNNDDDDDDAVVRTDGGGSTGSESRDWEGFTNVLRTSVASRPSDDNEGATIGDRDPKDADEVQKA